MSTRTTVSEVAFSRPFRLPGMDEPYPAGIYRVESDHQSLDLMAVSAFRRTASRIFLTRPGVTEVISFDWKDLEAALEKDVAG